jgi:hypothetical protein
MLDDALRLTVDKVFEPVYDFDKSHKEIYSEEQEKMFEKNKNKIEIDFNSVNINENKKLNNILSISRDSGSRISSAECTKSNNNKNNKNINSAESQKTNNTLTTDKINIFNTNLDIDNTDKNLIKSKEKQENINKENKRIIQKDINIVLNKNKILKENKNNNNNKRKLSDKDKEKEKFNKILYEKKYNGKYISPFPVPGYSNEENLWCFVCDLNSKDPYDIKMEKEKEKEKQKQNEKNSFTGIRHLLKKKDKKNNDKKRKKGKNNKTKNNKKY